MLCVTIMTDKEISTYLIRNYPTNATQIFIDYTSSTRQEPIETFAQRRSASIARNQRHHAKRMAGVDVGQIGYTPDDSDFVFLTDLESSIGTQARDIVYYIICGWRIREIAKMMGLTIKTVENEIENIKRYVIVSRRDK